MDEKGKRPYYGRATKREVLQRYRTEAVSTSELTGLHGIGGSNTVCRWAKEAGVSPAKKPLPDMAQPKDSPGEKKNKRRARQRNHEQLRISELEQQLDEARARAQLYSLALQLLSEEAGEDLSKKSGALLRAVHKPTGR